MRVFEGENDGEAAGGIEGNADRVGEREDDGEEAAGIGGNAKRVGGGEVGGMVGRDTTDTGEGWRGRWNHECAAWYVSSRRAS